MERQSSPSGCGSTVCPVWVSGPAYTRSLSRRNNPVTPTLLMVAGWTHCVQEAPPEETQVAAQATTTKTITTPKLLENTGCHPQYIQLVIS